MAPDRLGEGRVALPETGVRLIKGHKSRSQGNIVDLLATRGNYTCPTLPHYRYDAVKTTCARLRKLGLVRVAGRTGVAESIVPTNLFREWQRAFASKATNLGVINWAKERRRAVLHAVGEGGDVV